MEQTARGQSPQNIWLYHLLKSSEREPRLLELEDRVRSELEAVVSRLVRDAAKAHGMSPAQTNITGVNLVVQQALELQREHSSFNYVQMIRSLLAGDPALSEILGEVKFAALANAQGQFHEILVAERKSSLRRGALLGAAFAFALVGVLQML